MVLIVVKKIGRFFEWKGSRRKSFDPHDFNEHICTAISKAAHSPTSHIHTCHIVPPIFMNYDLIFQGKQGLGLALIIFLLVGVFQQLLGYKHSMQCLYEVASVIWRDILWFLFFFQGKQSLGVVPTVGLGSALIIFLLVGVFAVGIAQTFQLVSCTFWPTILTYCISSNSFEKFKDESFLSWLSVNLYKRLLLIFVLCKWFDFSIN